MQNDDLRKAAILIRSLDPDTAARLLGQLSPDEARAVRLAIREAADWDQAEEADVAAEFRRATAAVSENEQDAVEIDPGLLAASALADQAVAQPEILPPADTDSMLANTDIQKLLPLLQREHPQTVAVVLSRLDADKAAAVLDSLATPMQLDVVLRLSQLGEGDPESLRAVEDQLASLLAAMPSSQGSHAASVAHIANILAAGDPALRRTAIAHLSKQGHRISDQLQDVLADLTPEPAGWDRGRVAGDGNLSVETPREEAPDLLELPVEPAGCPETEAAADHELPPRTNALTAGPRLRFEEMSSIDSATLARVLTELEPEVVSLALAGADEALLGRVTQRLSWRGGRRLRRHLREIGPTRLSDVTRAQQAVAEAATQYLRVHHNAR